MKRLLAFVLAAFLFAPSLAGAADLRKLEAVGVVPMRAGSAAGAPRDAAVRAAVARGVERVAGGLLKGKGGIPGGEGSGPATDLSPALAVALGSDPFEYVSRFRILRDRGLRDALLSQQAGVTQEYVVEAEVTVDATRVRDRLQQAGWLTAAVANTGSRVLLVIEPLSSYQAYAELRRSLVDDVGVRSALPVEFSPGRAVLEVDTQMGPDSLLSALESQGDPNLKVVPVDREGDVLTLLVDWVGPPPGPARADPSEELGNPSSDN